MRVRSVKPPQAPPRCSFVARSAGATAGNWPAAVVLTLAVVVLSGAAAAADPRTVEDPAERARLPEFQVIPAASDKELTLTTGQPRAKSLRTWTVSHGDAGARRYSALTQINRENVKRLRPAWTYHSKDGTGNVQANPIIVDGIMYAPTPGRALVAIDATNGRELWRYQVEAPPQLGLDDAPARRGLVYWPGDARFPPRIVFASGKWVHALDPKTGKPLTDFGQEGRTPLPTGGTAVGVIYGSTYIVPGFSGDIYSYHLGNGRLIWRFHTIPREGEFGADTWVGAARVGANCWGGLSLDAERGIVFAAIGAARPDYIGVERHGDNLFSNCVVALDAKTGKRLWHFQNVRHDIWDMDNTAPPVLVTINIRGRRVDAVAAVTKLGNTLLLDRVSGKSVYPFRLRRAPVSTVPGEVTAPYQPDPELPEMFSMPDFGTDEVTERTPEAHAFVLKQVKKAAFGWFEPPRLGQPMLYQSSRGGAEWTGACVDVPTGRLYVSSNNLLTVATLYRAGDEQRDPAYPPSAGEKLYLQTCAACHGNNREGVGMVPTLLGLRDRMNDADVIELLKVGRSPMPPFPTLAEDGPGRRELLDFLMRRNQPPGRAQTEDDPRGGYFAVGYRFIKDHEGYPGCKPPWGLLNCIDLNTGRILWRVPLGEYEELTRMGVPKTGTENFGGPTITAGGLVFCTGTYDRKVRAFDADTGEELWAAELPFGGYAAPSVYEVRGRQYVVVNASGGGRVGTPPGDAYVAFALPEK